LHQAKPRWYQKRWLVALIALIVGAAIAGSAAASANKTKIQQVAGPTVTQQVPGPTVTQQVPGPTVTKKVPGPTVTKKVPGPTVTVTPGAASSFSDGTYVVGTDIQPGVYKTSGPASSGALDTCYWARLATLDGSLDSINANNNISGPTTVQVNSGDKAFEVSGGCSWSKID
jgi:hypothetical protein